MSSTIKLLNARVFDGVNADCPENMTILVQDGIIVEVSDGLINAQADHVFDVRGRTVMPGLIDAHIHAYGSNVDVQKIDAAGEAYRTAHAARMLRFALHCGFTTVRDIGGGDESLARAVQEGLITGPRFLYAGKMLSMTGGHGDTRRAHESQHRHGYCACGQFSALSIVVDGVEQCVKAAREELRRGAHCIKIMGSGGVASPTDPWWISQFRDDEIEAIVLEATRRRTYVAAHCHPAAAIKRCVELGVRCIEHGTLMDSETAQVVAERNAYVVPTLSVIYALRDAGASLGFPSESQAKLTDIYEYALSGLECMRDAGVRVGFGTDLLGETYTQQTREFSLRREVFSALEILRQATSTSAAILMHQDRLGCIKPGALADILVVDGDPLRDINLLCQNGAALSLVIRAGEIIRSSL